MGLETSNTIDGLNALWPLGSDPKSEGDNHLRLIKAVLQAVFSDTIDRDEITLLEPRLRIKRDDGPPKAVTLDFLDSDLVTVIASFTMSEDGFDLEAITTDDLTATEAFVTELTVAKILSDVILYDTNDKERGRMAANKTAGQGGLTLTAKDEAGDEKAKLIVSTVLQYSGDDSTKIVQLDQARQATGTTRKIFVPAAPIDTTLGKWEPILDENLAGVTSKVVTDLSGFRRLRLGFAGTVSLLGFLRLQFSQDNGSTFKTGATDYSYQYTNGRSSVVGAGSGTDSGLVLQNSADANNRQAIEGVLEDFNLAFGAGYTGDALVISTGGLMQCSFASRANFVGPNNAFRLVHTAGGAIFGYFSLEGWR